jgi:hypothetical protein
MKSSIYLARDEWIITGSTANIVAVLITGRRRDLIRAVRAQRCLTG